MQCEAGKRRCVNPVAPKERAFFEGGRSLSPDLSPQAGEKNFRCPASPAEVVPIGIRHVVPSSQFVPLPSPAARLPGAAGPFFARVSCVRACARLRAYCAGAVRAPDCARETPDAPCPSVPAGAFLRAPAIALLRRKTEKAAPKPPLSAFIILHFSPSQAPGRRKYEKILFRRPDAAAGALACRRPVAQTGRQRPSDGKCR